jgi:hypothetical protein
MATARQSAAYQLPLQIRSCPKLPQLQSSTWVASKVVLGLPAEPAICCAQAMHWHACAAAAAAAILQLWLVSCKQASGVPAATLCLAGIHKLPAAAAAEVQLPLLLYFFALAAFCSLMRILFLYRNRRFICITAAAAAAAAVGH